ncbi:putative cyclopropane-fatty-acyl-phospholipid synthase [Helianthus annuus]|nr:putative cyclopropane-fatty-acyl-phospholipid synthase [Helianthus annuus]
MRVSVIGGGISGLVSAYALAKEGVEVVLYEKEDYLGGHAKTVVVDGIDLDLEFMAFNPVTSPNMMELFETLGVDMKVSDMSFSVSLDDVHGCEWGSRNGFSSLFSQKKNLLNPRFWHMLWEVTKFKDDVLRYLEHNRDTSHCETLQSFIKSHGYSELFQESYLVPMCSSIWPFPAEQILSSSAFLVLSFLHNHHNLQVFGHHQWLTTRSGSHTYVKKLKEDLERRGCQIRTGCSVQSVSKLDNGCLIICEDGSQERCNGCIIATHTSDALRMIGEQASYEEKRILSAFNYVYSDMFLHRDTTLMPQNQTAWSACNFRGSTMDKKVCLTYWLNVIQNTDNKGLPFLVTINPPRTPESTVLKWSTKRPVTSVAASKASFELHTIQGKRNIVFCGAYQGFGLHEDGVKVGIVAANIMLNKSYEIINNPKPMVPSLMETGARLIEERGIVFTFEGSKRKSPLKVYLKVHNPQFYWKIITQAELGFADAYIKGDVSFTDKNEGLLNMLMLFIVNSELQSSASRFKKRGWWTPMFLTAALSNAKYIYHHVMRKNTISQARSNISQHYDLSNELFSLFMDDTMQYSCAIFKSKDDDLKTAQLRKISSLIEKARVNENHEVLDIGCGWGRFGIELVKQTGCKYTGITLSKEQIKYAESKVKEAGLQDQIRFLLCDYRQLPDTSKYDRIISCEAIEHVGHAYYEQFFGCCESALKDDGIFVLQFISVQDGKYDEFRQAAGFAKEYIFPGGNLPSLNRLISAMTASSKLCVDHVEQIGKHYYQTLRCWRANFLKNHSKILSLGFNQEFIRIWEYYFDYCAAGYKTEILLDYQVVFSRPGKTNDTLGDPYKTAITAY